MRMAEGTAFRRAKSGRRTAHVPDWSGRSNSPACDLPSKVARKRESIREFPHTGNTRPAQPAVEQLSLGCSLKLGLKSYCRCRLPIVTKLRVLAESAIASTSSSDRSPSLPETRGFEIPWITSAK